MYSPKTRFAISLPTYTRFEDRLLSFWERRERTTSAGVRVHCAPLPARFKIQSLSFSW